MEINLFSIWWNKLLDALRFKSPSTKNNHQLHETSTSHFNLNSHGISIVGRMFFPETHPSKLYPVIIICHGIPGSGTSRPDNDPGYESLAEFFTENGFAAVFFNFRGCGDSGGNFDIKGWTQDLEAVLDKTANTAYIDPTRIMAVGFSGGGAAAIKVAADSNLFYALATGGTPADFTIFDAEPTEIVDDFKKRGIIRDQAFPQNISKWISEFEEIDPKRWVSQFSGKHLLIMHGDEDELVPVEHAQILFKHAPAGIAELQIIKGGVHRLRLDPRCPDDLNRWFLKILGGPIS
jgi:uncharacterized protein